MPYPPKPLVPELVPENLPNVQCLHCLKVVPQPFYVARHFERGIVEHLPFCDELCHELYYLSRLRESGL